MCNDIDMGHQMIHSSLFSSRVHDAALLCITCACMMVVSCPEEENLRYLCKIYDICDKYKPEVHQVLTDAGLVGHLKRHMFYHCFPQLHVGAFSLPMVRLACLAVHIYRGRPGMR